MYNKHCLIKCPLELQANVLYKHTVLYEYMASCHKYISKASLSFTMSKQIQKPARDHFQVCLAKSSL